MSGAARAGAAAVAPRSRTRYRLENLSRLDDGLVDELVRFAFDELPTIDRLVAVRVADGAGPSGRAYGGDFRPRWAGRARYAMLSRVVADDHQVLGRAKACWHSTRMKDWHRARYHAILAERPELDRADESVRAAVNREAIADTYSWVEELAAGGATRVGRFPIYRVDTAEEALLHVLAHEGMHVLQYDRERVGRGRHSEVLVEEAALRVLAAYRDLTSGRRAR